MPMGMQNQISAADLHNQGGHNQHTTLVSEENESMNAQQQLQNFDQKKQAAQANLIGTNRRQPGQQVRERNQMAGMYH